MCKVLDSVCNNTGFSGDCKLLSTAGAQSLSGRPVGVMRLGAGKWKREGQVAKVLTGAWIFQSTLHAFPSHLVTDPNFPPRNPLSPPPIQVRGRG